MLRPADFLRFLITLGSLLALTVQAQSRVVAAEEREALQWLRKAPLAAKTLNYSGTFVYQQGSRLRSSRITHVVEGHDRLEKLEVLDGPPREYVRRNEEVVYYAPDRKAVLIEQRLAHTGFPAFLARDPAELLPYYHLRFGEAVRVAGHECRTVALVPKDDLRYGYNLCLEGSSGLLLRIQTLAQGRIIEQVSFSQIVWGEIASQLVQPTYANVQGWRVERSTLQQVELPDLRAGFLPPGFERTVTVKRFLTQPAAEISGDDANLTSQVREVVQIVFSDGLAAISVFIEPDSQRRMEGANQQGAVNMIGRRLGEFWLTIVGEVPAITVKQIADSVEFKSINKSEP